MIISVCIIQKQGGKDNLLENSPSNKCESIFRMIKVKEQYAAKQFSAHAAASWFMIWPCSRASER